MSIGARVKGEPQSEHRKGEEAKPAHAAILRSAVQHRGGNGRRRSVEEEINKLSPGRTPV